MSSFPSNPDIGTGGPIVKSRFKKLISKLRDSGPENEYKENLAELRKLFITITKTYNYSANKIAKYLKLMGKNKKKLNIIKFLFECFREDDSISNIITNLYEGYGRKISKPYDNIEYTRINDIGAVESHDGWDADFKAKDFIDFLNANRIYFEIQDYESSCARNAINNLLGRDVFKKIGFLKEYTNDRVKMISLPEEEYHVNMIQLCNLSKSNEDKEYHFVLLENECKNENYYNNVFPQCFAYIGYYCKLIFLDETLNPNIFNNTELYNDINDFKGFIISSQLKSGQNLDVHYIAVRFYISGIKYYLLVINSKTGIMAIEVENILERKIYNIVEKCMYTLNANKDKIYNKKNDRQILNAIYLICDIKCLEKNLNLDVEITGNILNRYNDYNDIISTMSETSPEPSGLLTSSQEKSPEEEEGEAKQAAEEAGEGQEAGEGEISSDSDTEDIHDRLSSSLLQPIMTIFAILNLIGTRGEQDGEPQQEEDAASQQEEDAASQQEEEEEFFDAASQQEEEEEFFDALSTNLILEGRGRVFLNLIGSRLSSIGRRLKNIEFGEFFNNLGTAILKLGRYLKNASFRKISSGYQKLKELGNNLKDLIILLKYSATDKIITAYGITKTKAKKIIKELEFLLDKTREEIKSLINKTEIKYSMPPSTMLTNKRPENNKIRLFDEENKFNSSLDNYYPGIFNTEKANKIFNLTNGNVRLECYEENGTEKDRAYSPE